MSNSGFLVKKPTPVLHVAGIPMGSAYGSKFGFCSSSMADDYQYLVVKDADGLPRYAATGMSANMIANN